MERSNYIHAGVTLQSMYDDDPYLMSNSVSNYSVSIFPQLQLNQSRSRIRWLLDYAGGFTFNEQLAQQNQTSQSLNFDLHYRITQHASLRASQSVNYISGLFGSVNSLNGSIPGAPQGTNPFVLTPLAKQFNAVTRVEIGDQLSAADIVGASGGFNDLQFQDAPPTSSLLNTREESASGYYMHRLTPANWVGTNYSFEHLGYPGTLNNTIVHRVVLFDSYTVKRNMTISLFGGPQYYNDRFETDTVPPQLSANSKWSIAGGAGLGWHGQRTSAQVAYVHRISDGGGVQSSVQVNSVNGGLRHEFASHWGLSLNAGYAANDALTPAALGALSTKYASAGLTVTRTFGENIVIQAGYSRQNQTQSGSSSPGVNANRNLVIASFSYQFARPWGR
jgi:hypothetical protein